MKNITTNTAAKCLVQTLVTNGVKVSKTEEFDPAFDSALKADKATLIEITIAPQALTPAKTLSEIRNNK